MSTPKKVAKLWKDLGAEEKKSYLTAHAPDCSFIVGGDKEKKCASHKWILSEVSPVFEKMFDGNFKESSSVVEIPLPEDEPDGFVQLLHYIYYNKLGRFGATSVETAICLYELGNKYMIPGLTERCLEFFKTTYYTTYSYPKEKLELRKERYDDRELVNAFQLFYSIEEPMLKSAILNVMQIYIRELEWIISSLFLFFYIEDEIKNRVHQNGESMIKCVCILELNSKMFYEIIKALKDGVREIVRFNMIKMYANINNLLKIKNNTEIETTQPNSNNIFESADGIPEKDTISLEEMLESIQYMKMTWQEFISGPGKFDFFNSDEKYDLLTNILMK